MPKPMTFFHLNHTTSFKNLATPKSQGRGPQSLDAPKKKV